MGLPSNFPFFSPTKFAVVGASTDRSKYGNKVLRWYLDRSLPVTPVHPKEAEIEGIKTVKSLDDLPDPQSTSLSIITPPKISLDVIKTAQKLGIPALWLQPGAQDEAVVRYIDDEGVTAAHSGPCILVIGDSLRDDSKRQRESSL